MLHAMKVEKNSNDRYLDKAIWKHQHHSDWVTCIKWVVNTPNASRLRIRSRQFSKTKILSIRESRMLMPFPSWLKTAQL